MDNVLMESILTNVNVHLVIVERIVKQVSDCACNCSNCDVIYVVYNFFITWRAKQIVAIAIVKKVHVHATRHVIIEKQTKTDTCTKNIFLFVLSCLSHKKKETNILEVFIKYSTKQNPKISILKPKIGVKRRKLRKYYFDFIANHYQISKYYFLVFLFDSYLQICFGLYFTVGLCWFFKFS